jgi:hypothetical protein
MRSSTGSSHEEKQEAHAEVKAFPTVSVPGRHEKPPSDARE